MVDIVRPVFGEVWAASGEKLAPESTKIQSGWIQEMMPYQYENFLQNRQDVAITYLMQKGVAEWSDEQEYTANKSVVQYQGHLYIATSTVTNVIPTVTASWRKLTVSIGTNGAIPIAFGGTGANTAEQARVNLGIGSAGNVDLPATSGVLVKLANNTLTSRAITGTAGLIEVVNGDGAAGNPTISVGTNVAKTNADAAWTTNTSIRLPAGSSSQRGVEASGRIRFNTELSRFEGFDGAKWSSLGDSSGTVDVQTVATNGVQSSFNLTYIPNSKNNIFVYINGVYQEKTSYSLSGNVIVFTEPPDVGTLEIVPISAAPSAPTGSWSPQSPIANAVEGTEIATINSILTVMRAAGLISN